ncbi:entericidin A/B family lipoprotein [Methylophilus medardicus]|uniref:Entericidin A/B family lipoprotein n=1 Tax=Methylophilus medardicus TaxID=2588534 RepID=A0A5B8CT40_9PROT|nr:entericidin A/B family lipoprotein [Methylophilus medardicus]QDC44246.1 entericidin A/B family lipoprotein [Methylophilus medardicus]QDC49253.1 entericidin A/B family lipoprotein [Methylophilus medardicus]QDC52958.1 entericidin A/B family lipoprotein [Methylophilus medardicus]
MTKWIALMVTMVALTGCNTINGMGKDIEQAGEAVQKSSK